MTHTVGGVIFCDRMFCIIINDACLMDVYRVSSNYISFVSSPIRKY